MWANIYRSGSRYLDADAELVSWDSGRVSQIQSQGTDPATVVHIFKQNSGGCGQSFNFTGYWWSNIAGAYGAMKWADCVPWTTGPNNELRMYYPRANMVGGQSYQVGGEFTDQGGGSLNGEVTYDTYYGSSKDYHSKWCFNGSDSVYAVDAQGRCY